MARFSVHSPSAAGKGPVRRAVAALEFALIAPIFVLLLLGIVELGRLLMVQGILVNAVRVGARLAIVSGSTNSQVQTAIQNYLTTAKISGYNTPTISPSLSPQPASGTPITVTASVPWSKVSWIGGIPLNLTGTTPTASLVMVHE